MADVKRPWAPLAPPEHGGEAPAGTLDFSTGLSPLPLPPELEAAIRAADVRAYPQPTALPLRTKLGVILGYRAEELVIGNGSTELIWALARCYGGPRRTVAILAPAFGEYAQAAHASGATVYEITAEGPAFTWSESAVLRDLLAVHPALVFLARPSTPCLVTLPLGVLLGWAERLPQTLFVVDEAYLPLFDGVEPPPLRPNLVRLCSMTKVLALAGLRLGYLLASPTVAARVQGALPPWNVSAMAIAGGCAALDHARLPEICAAITELREDLCDVLRRACATVEASGGPFVLCRVPDARRAKALLRERGIWVRDCTSFGLPQHLRLGVRPRAEQRQLGAAWQACGGFK